ncbi:Peptidyl-prolyl cis-trans isomerase CYP59 [Babesia sp. Xinjiang]|uniref:Peptidyl-prolyl cis-trans isomerase CYP59 n=1 Tax=Babesia sp. Xinjiang TaxID=462227 RepID=UPI000A22702C|nr:Peptidyl-prolyl cis-trans isomerase CYP59 [Babesia sp. Xinjiang]ORM41861.1 Peptidyl-prolyl cis-trans isomerase CYP59 [Babesia sp. Xinjiang]
MVSDLVGSESKVLAREFLDLEELKAREARSRAVVLEILGDIPDADVSPPKNVLFVCKLNPVTESDDLKLIFSRFGPVVSCDVIRDYKTGDSLQYAFVEFESEESCNDAYFRMQNVLIDDRRIHVDFCQSVSGFWKRYKANESFTRASVTAKGRAIRDEVREGTVPSHDVRSSGTTTGVDPVNRTSDGPSRSRPIKIRRDRSRSRSRDRRDRYSRSSIRRSGHNHYRRHHHHGGRRHSSDDSSSDSSRGHSRHRYRSRDDRSRRSRRDSHRRHRSREGSRHSSVSRRDSRRYHHRNRV